MGLIVFFGLAILGIDFLIYALFQWTWGDKRRAIARQVAAHRREYDTQPRRPFLVSSRQAAPTGIPGRTEADAKQATPVAEDHLVRNAS